MSEHNMQKKERSNGTEKNYSSIPAGACILTVGEFELGDNGDGAKSAPIRLVARSGKAIEHWFWGRVIHDFAGMHLHKSRLPVDYVHDPKEVIGYLNKFDTESGDLVTNGALVPFKESDRATEIIHKSNAGVPYEASINFGGDGIKVQEIMDGETTEVNGAQFDGPGLVIREWPLRGVAICPYGADANTESSVLAGNNATTYSAAVVAAPKATTKEPSKMKTEQESVEVEAKVETPEAEKAELTKPVEAKDEEAAEEAAEAVDPAAVETSEAEAEEEKPAETEETEVPEVEQAQEDAKPELSREEFTRIAEAFGNEVAAQTMKDGGNYESALQLAYETVKAERDSLSAERKTAGKNGTPVRVVDDKKREGLFKTGK